MGGQKFQYDESGGTFFYFLLSFLALLLVPGTYYWWPRKVVEDPTKYEKDCHCKGCKKKQNILKSNEPWKGTKQLLTKLVIVLGWLCLALLAYKVSQFDYEYANFDPYEILGVPMGSSMSEIKRAYKTLSLTHHPDKKTGDEKAFMKLNKAYKALTDPESRKNWEKYGNPDGPGAMSFGIALPSWIVEKENSVWVLGLYALVFMVALPTVVGIWWYRSIQYTGDQVLLSTSQMYFYFFHRTPCMPLKRVILILSASLEFEKQYNSEIVERPTDNIEYPQIMKQLSNFGEKNKEKPICYLYALRARVIMFAHLSRIPLPEKTLDKDRMYIIKKCPYLIREMVNVVSTLIMLAYARRVSRLLSIETIENCMKLCPMLVQGMWEYKSPLLQLPHVGEEHLKFFLSKKVIDDEASTVFTAGATVTVSVTMVRKYMQTLFGDETINVKYCDAEADAEPKEGEEEDETKAKEKEAKKEASAAGGDSSGADESDLSDDDADRSDDEDSGDKNVSHLEWKTSLLLIFKSHSTVLIIFYYLSYSFLLQEAMEDDDDWAKFQSNFTRRRDWVLEGKSKLSHTVHCPYFPEEKQEYWWVYISDRKSRTLLTTPVHITGLVDKEEVQLNFTAPRWPGVYIFTVCLRSDSYLGFDQTQEIKLDVKEAPEVPVDHPQWEISGEEEEEAKPEGDASDISEFATDEDIDE
ncbi:unnamed protein product [Nesidiocoris tenuis]|uniref:J domain-containing protein n=1 Tax=Nesidiocoris tenuis TaxID=355587 RepID=A0A6H5GWN4_9HEMI|nr:unnamed protein product [Nesidiocoris tenuis]